MLNIGIQGTGDLRDKMDGKDVKENFVFVKYFSDKPEKRIKIGPFNFLCYFKLFQMNYFVFLLQ